MSESFASKYRCLGSVLAKSLPTFSCDVVGIVSVYAQEPPLFDRAYLHDCSLCTQATPFWGERRTSFCCQQPFHYESFDTAICSSRNSLDKGFGRCANASSTWIGCSNWTPL